MERPHIADAPGLAWRPRKNGWAAVWLARQDLARKGFKPSTHQIAVYYGPLTEQQETAARATCVRLQEEMYAYGEAKPKEFAGTVMALIAAYQTDPDSPYQTMRYQSRKALDSYLRSLSNRYGTVKLADVGAREFKRWYEDTRWPNGKDGPERVSSAHALMTTVRMMIGFGASFEVEKTPRDKMSECRRLREILSDLSFEKGKGRTETLSLRQCEDIIAAANANGLPSIALAQALQREIGLRQRDVIGEWVPMKEPGVSAITWHGNKWLRGIRWEEISSNLILTHTMSKSRKGKVIEFDLNLYPLIMAELNKIPAEKRVGPLLVCEITGRPWKQVHFGRRWRVIATIANIPSKIQNRDSRSGIITEIIDATNGNLEAARKMAGHSDVRTTQGYSRDNLRSNNKTAAIVTNFRSKNVT